MGDIENSATLPSSDDDDDGNDGMYLGNKTKGDVEYDNVPKLPDDELLNEPEDDDDNDLYISDGDGMATPQAKIEGDEETKGFGDIPGENENENDNEEYDAMYIKP